MYPTMVAVVDDFLPQLVLHELCELAAAPVARSRGIPHVTVGFSGAPYAALLAPAAEAMAGIWALEGLEVPEHVGIFDHLYLHPWPTGFGARPERPEIVDSAHMGYDGRTAESQVPEWLPSMGVERPLVYVSFGTEVGAMAPWPSVLDALASLDVDAVITTGHAVDLSIHGTMPSNVRIEAYVPQSLLMDRATVMVSHAGAGAIAATIAHGVPQVCVPMVADQWDNADAAVAAGIGVVLEREHRSSAAIAAAISALSDDAVTRGRVDSWRSRASGMTAVDAVVDGLLAISA
jgi:UDP:flavonoid glycosyltransferase YjiC (YdhE family)